MIAKPQKIRGFTLIEIMIVVLIIGMVVSIATPMFIRYRESAQKQICIKNLSQIESAKQQWGLENKKSSGAPVLDADIFGPDKWIKITPDCPGGGIYSVGDVGVTLATCTLSSAGHTL